MSSKAGHRKMKKVIEEILEITGWNQSELARHCHVDRATIFRWLASGDAARTPRGTAELVLNQILERAKAGDFKQPASVPA